MNRALAIIEEIYVCPEGHYKQSVWRPRARQRGKMHKKWLFCVNCGYKKNFIKGGGL